MPQRIIIAIVVAVALVVAVLVLGPAACNKIRSLGAQNRLNQGQMGAQSNSAADAVATQGAANKRETDSEAMTRSNEKEIRNAQGANDPVNPDARDAGLRALCLRHAYRDSPRCRVFRSAPK